MNNFIKKFIIIFLLTLLVSCSGHSGSNGKEDEFVKKITIKIIDDQSKEQRYLLNVMTNGKQVEDAAQLPENSFIITNEKKEAKKQFHLNTKYTIKVSKTNARTIKELSYNKQNGNAEPLLTTVEFTPTNDNDILEIKVKDK
ncbi:hypothetical protein ABES38_11690 [Bacillus gobiensis]|uniref:hypothetical protein n=1 Tax=Bacillus gobiensis TaxID=1441095 RepID=UPI003D222D3F